MKSEDPPEQAAAPDGDTFKGPEGVPFEQTSHIGIQVQGKIDPLKGGRSHICTHTTEGREESHMHPHLLEML